MENWEESVAGRTSFGLMKVAEAAVSVPLWEYVALAFGLLLIALYRVMEFHFIEDLVRGFRGEIPLLHHSVESELAEHILPQCKNLKRRFCATPWLSSPHLQAAFLHFKGNPPQIEYHRELFITPDKGTVALDWVKPLLTENETGIFRGRTARKLEELPVVIVIPGLTSESNDPYVKHIAYSSATKGWRALIVNHRGLGGVSITSDQFYNAGWTEDLRRIINHVHLKYPQAPIFTIGTSIGANILVKYLGEEGTSTPVGAAAAVNCPWDLLICNRFLFRKGIQKLYNRVLAFGLINYLGTHHVAIGQIAEWRDVMTSKSIYEVDHHFTRHTGKYETVDTYYRRTCSADYLTKVAVPLLCFSALDDPICTKEAIPWDEVTANPNVIMVVTRHGSHLAYFEGLTAQSIWWVRGLTDYIAAMISGNLMHTPQKITGTVLETLEESDLKAPHLSASSSGQAVSEDSHLSSLVVTDGVSVCEKDVQHENKVGSGDDEDNALSTGEVETPEILSNEATVTLTFKKKSELTALQSALSQLLSQLQASQPPTIFAEHLNLTNAQDEGTPIIGVQYTAAEALMGQLKQSAVSTFQMSPHRSFEVPVKYPVVSALKRCRETAKNLAFTYNLHQRSGVDDHEPCSSASERNFSDQPYEHEVVSRDSNRRLLQAGSWNSEFALVSAQNRRNLWLLMYIAFVTTCPLIGSAFLIRWRGKLMSMTKGLL